MEYARQLLDELIDSVNLPTSASATEVEGDPFSGRSDFHVVIRFNGPDSTQFPYSVRRQANDPVIQTFDVTLTKDHNTLHVSADALRRGVFFSLDLDTISDEIIENVRFALRPADGEHRTLELIDLWQRIFPLINAEYANGRSSRVTYVKLGKNSLGLTGHVHATMP